MSLVGRTIEHVEHDQDQTAKVRRHRARPADTSPEIWTMQIHRWAAMTPMERLAIANQLSIDVRLLAHKATARPS